MRIALVHAESALRKESLATCRITIAACLALLISIVETPAQSTVAQVRFIKAYVVDRRLSALRRQPDQKSHVLRRVSLGRPVYVLGSKQAPNAPLFYRVAVTRRTRGWIHSKAVAIPGRAGHDQMLWSLILGADSDFDRISLCRILLGRFERSEYLPKALLQIADDAESAGIELTRRARRRLSPVEANQTGIAIRDWYLNDPSLDRYNRLGVRFDFDSKDGSLVYDGEAYRELIRRFPRSVEAETARLRLAGRPDPATSRSNGKRCG
jgi:hypothetical protein